MGSKFGVAFCEGFGVAGALARNQRGDDRVRQVTHSRFFPVNVLNTIKTVPEVCTIRRATANPNEVVIVETEPGRGILAVIDGSKSQGIEVKAAPLGVTLWQVGLKIIARFRDAEIPDLLPFVSSAVSIYDT